ncbi:hypothetical protein GDO86_003349 [Hymenochirus boettgeri]|uniref:Mitochondrial nucleoid factor 1 n=1 Tax=Hymenochirus boettgeri TaxID=247094 RepID=A0A8T2K5D3_9PIPI|nr:hypothetical protein GDO86_003349 [Hymenochirus boettgeri]
MAAQRYRRFMKLCEDWPLDDTRIGRDLGAFLRQRVAQAFREGDNTQVYEPVACDQMWDSLSRLNTSYYKEKVLKIIFFFDIIPSKLIKVANFPSRVEPQDETLG